LYTVTLKPFVHYSVADPGRPKLPPKNKKQSLLLKFVHGGAADREGPQKEERDKKEIKKIWILSVERFLSLDVLYRIPRRNILRIWKKKIKLFVLSKMFSIFLS
jgi:hypothetical protein